MGNLRNWIGASGLSLLACGGIVQRGADDDAGGASSGGPAAHTTRAGSSNGAGSITAVTGGRATTSGGATMVTPTLPADSGAACFNDVDCPGSACGGEVCNWSKLAATPVGPKAFFCNAAGSQPDATDGWCTTDADCKCFAEGARCHAPYCTFTRLRGL